MSSIDLETKEQLDSAYFNEELRSPNMSYQCDLEDLFSNEPFQFEKYLLLSSRKGDLSSICERLKEYGSQLHAAMSDILKSETEAIVNLAENLTNFNSKISNLIIPAAQLQEQLKVFKNISNDTKTHCHLLLDKSLESDKCKEKLILKNDFFATLIYLSTLYNESLKNDINLAERVVLRYSNKKNYMKEKNVICDSKHAKFLENKFVGLTMEFFAKSLKSGDTNVLLKSLRMFLNLARTDIAEEHYRVHFVRPVLQPLFSEVYLEKCGQDIDQIYGKVLNFFHSDVFFLVSIVKRNEDLRRQFKFITNSFWKELDKLSREGLPYLTAAGNPDLFHKRYCSTYKLLLEIFTHCEYDDGSILQHLKRFNLYVYFEIKYQQIATDFETALIVPAKASDIFMSKIEEGFQLKASYAFYKCIFRCFSSNTYIPSLAFQFSKLFMMCLRRFEAWAVILAKGNMFSSESTEDVQRWDSAIVKLLEDINLLREISLRTNIEETYGGLPVGPQTAKPVLEKLWRTNSNILSVISKNVIEVFVKAKVVNSIHCLQNVGSIPRLFRKTNREFPTTASLYLEDGMKPIIEFYARSNPQEHALVLKPIAESFQLILINEYTKLVSEVLTSVCKMEESLRRLKSRNTVSVETSSTTQMTDEMKIRTQIKLDVIYFTNCFETHIPIVSTVARQKLNALKSLIL